VKKRIKMKIELGALRFLSIGLGFLLLFHGLDKLAHGTWGAYKVLDDLGIPFKEYLRYVVFAGEIVAPLFLVFGQFTRLAGGFIAVYMFLIILFVQHEKVFTLGQHGGWAIELPVLYMLGGITLFLSKE